MRLRFLAARKREDIFTRIFFPTGHRFSAYISSKYMFSKLIMIRLLHIRFRHNRQAHLIDIRVTTFLERLNRWNLLNPHNFDSFAVRYI